MKTALGVLVCTVIGHMEPECEQIILVPLALRTHTHWCPRCDAVLLAEVSPYPDNTDLMMMADPGLHHEDARTYLS